MQLNNISKFDKCANCGACSNICPVGAISVDSDCVYYTPRVDSSKCINCGKCVKVCPVNTPKSYQNLVNAYAGWHRDDEVVKESSSGGAFHTLAERVIEQGGVVFGAAFSEDFKTVKFASTEQVSLKQLQKSKYVECINDNTFKSIQDYLINGRAVLFCGTPCEAAGLRRFLENDYDNLIICDFSCGGCPSHRLYSDYIQNQEDRMHSVTTNVDFRPKTYGWSNHCLKINYQNGESYVKISTLDPYYLGFVHKRITQRDYCYTCDFSNNHASDIILADYWLSGKISNLDNNNRGISLIITNSKRGDAFVKDIKDKFYMLELDINQAGYNIKSGYADQTLIEQHNAFIEYYQVHGYKAAAKKFLRLNLAREIKQRIREAQMRRNHIYEG